jgi:FKBP-type peptidyl-prolyl cis-trans isomerase SlyD
MVVSLTYEVRLDDGQLVDFSEDEPFQYIHGQGAVIPGLEEALAGMKPGESKKVTIPPKQAYGERVEGATQWIPRAAFPVEEDLVPGMVFQVEDEEGQAAPIFVKEIEEERVLVDYNHPLAGETLHYAVTIEDVRPATEEELAHGHVHGGAAHP